MWRRSVQHGGAQRGGAQRSGAQRGGNLSAESQRNLRMVFTGNDYHNTTMRCKAAGVKTIGFQLNMGSLENGLKLVCMTFCLENGFLHTRRLIFSHGSQWYAWPPEAGTEGA